MYPTNVWYDEQQMHYGHEYVSSVLAGYSPGQVPPAVFTEIARLVATPIVELVPLRAVETDTGLQVQMWTLQRSQDDPVWPGQWHTPGAAIRAGDDHLGKVFKRLYHDELALTEKPSTPVFVGNRLYQSERGVEQAQIFWVTDLPDDVPVGKWQTADPWPANMVSSQHQTVAMAVAHFLTRQSNGQPLGVA